MTECKSFNAERRIVSEAFVDWAYAYQGGKASINVDIFRVKIAIAYMKISWMSSYRKHTPHEEVPAAVELGLRSVALIGGHRPRDARAEILDVAKLVQRKDVVLSNIPLLEADS